jgi:hypothetical protein
MLGMVQSGYYRKPSSGKKGNKPSELLLINLKDM